MTHTVLMCWVMVSMYRVIVTHALLICKITVTLTVLLCRVMVTHCTNVHGDINTYCIIVQGKSDNSDNSNGTMSKETDRTSGATGMGVAYNFSQPKTITTATVGSKPTTSGKEVREYVGKMTLTSLYNFVYIYSILLSLFIL